MTEIQSPKARNSRFWNIQSLELVLASDFAFRISDLVRCMYGAGAVTNN
jgi:hypothetical protein